MQTNTKNLFIISGPSCAGEDATIRGLAKYLPIERVITTTTRSMRDGESDGNPYHFVSEKEFEDLIIQNRLFEFKFAQSAYYGVTNDEIKRIIDQEKIAIWKVEIMGVVDVKKRYPDITTICINAPIGDLERRIRKRDADKNEEYFQGRLEYSKEWGKHRDSFDFWIESPDGKLEETIAKVREIIEAKIKK